MKLIIVEDERRVQNNILNKINRLSNFCEVVGTAENGFEGLKLVEILKPDVVITDVKMPVMDGIEMSEQIKKRFPDIKIIILSGFSDFAIAQKAIRFGVFNYLVKPVEDEKLLETLHELKIEIDKLERIDIPNVLIHKQLYSNIKQNNNQDDNTKFVILLICLNNLCCDNDDVFLQQYYFQQFESIDWSRIFDNDVFYNVEWVISEEYSPNQRSIIISLCEKGDFSPIGAAKIIRSQFKLLYPDIMVNICCHQKLLNSDELYLTAKRMRRIIAKEVVPSEPRIFILEENENIYIEEIIVEEIKQRADESIKTLLKSSNYSALRKSFEQIIHFTTEKKLPQHQFLVIINYLLKRLEFEISSFDISKERKLQTELLREISISASTRKIEDIFLQCIDVYLEEFIINEMQQTKDVILNYVDENYSTIECLEDVADIFNYNYTYFSRLFKKITGMSMVKYITKKRIEKAKKLLIMDPNISVGMVGSLVGYADQQYFGRTFKDYTGQSPSEFKKSQ